MKAIAIDLGGSHASLGLIEDRTILATRELALDASLGIAPALPIFAGLTRELLCEHGTTAADCAGLALSFCGLADFRTGRVVSTDGKYDDAPSIDLPRWCYDELGLVFAIENDARMALLGESYAGAARTTSDAVMITLGTGIGGAAMMNGQLVRGKHVQGGCLGGHLPSVLNGRKCLCGAVGCTEAEASGWALPLIAREWDGFAESALAREPSIDFRALFSLADAGDPVSQAIRDRCLQVWAAGAVGLVHAYDPEKIVMGGGVMRRADLIVPFVQAYVKQHAWTPWGTVEVVAAELGNHAGLLGAIPLLKMLLA